MRLGEIDNNSAKIAHMRAPAFWIYTIQADTQNEDLISICRTTSNNKLIQIHKYKHTK